MSDGNHVCRTGRDYENAGWCRRLTAIVRLVLISAIVMCGFPAPQALAKTFSHMAEMGSTRYGHSVTLLPNGKVLIAGGYNDASCLRTAEIFDPETGAITPTRNMVAARMDHTATLLANGKVLILGGRNGTATVNTAEIFDPVQGTFNPIADTTVGRVGHTSTLLPSGKVLIAGGTSDNTYVTAAEIFDPETETFSATAAMVDARRGHTATAMTNGKVLLAGGMKGNAYVSTAEIFDPVTGTFSAAASMQSARVAHTATLLSDGRVLIAGGRNGSSIVNSAEIYDPATATFAATAGMNSERDDHTATLMPDGTVLIAGGRDARGYLDTAEVFEPESATFIPTSNMTSIREIHAAILLPNSKVLIAGGWNGFSAAGSAEIFDPEYVCSIFKLSLNTVGKGEGAVRFSPGRSCSGSCSQFFRSGTEVTLSPVLDNNTTFLGWSGCDAVSGTDCFVTMTNNKRVKLKTTECEQDDGKDTYLITASAGPHGSISPSGQTPVVRGANQTFTIASDPGYHVEQVLIDGRRDMGPLTSFTFTKVKKPHTISATFALNDAITITAQAGEHGSISPSGEVAVAIGDTKSFAILPAAGYQVADVLVDGVSVGAVSTYSFTNLTANHTISASFTPIVYSITTTAGLNGSIDPAGVVSVNSGSGFACTITPAAGFKVADVLVDNASVGAVTSYTIAAVTANHTIAASFTPIVYSITATAGLNGSIDPAGVASINSGAGQSYTITPAGGYKVADVLVDGVSVGAVTSYGFTNVTANHTIAASFTSIVYTITATAGVNGSIDPVGTVNVTSGSAQSYAIAPAAGFKVLDVLVDNVSVGAVTSYGFTNVTANHTIVASFTPIVYTITATAGVNGSIDPAGVASVNSGSAQGYAIVPATGFKVLDVLVDGVSVGAVTSYSFNNVTANHTINASFTPIVYTITATAGVNGSIDPAGTVNVNSGGAQSYTITPDAGYKVGDVLVDTASVGKVTSYSFNTVTTNHTITASFTPLVPNEDFFIITATAGANGSISPVGDMAVLKGNDSPLITITPAVGYKVANVLVDGASKGAVSSYTFAAVTANHTITASFTAQTYAITPIQAANGTITPASTVYVGYGGSRYCTITPSVGYHTVDVLVDGVSVGGVTSYTFTNVSADHTITAVFAENPSIVITATAGANGSISPAGDVTVVSGTSPTFIMTAASGFRVANVVVDGVSKGALTSYTFTKVTAVAHSIAVTFTEDVFTITASAGSNGSIAPAGATTVARGGDSPTYTITPAEGYKVANVLVDGVSKGAITSYTFTGVTANHTIAVTFTQLVYAITPEVGPNGTMTPAITVYVNYGGSRYCTITPDPGYHIVDVLVDGVSVGAVATYTFSSIMSDHSIAATFAPNQPITITATAGPNGSISPSGAITVLSGSSPTFTMTPAAGYRVADILVDGVSKGAANSYTFANVSATNHTICVSFMPDVYTITATAGLNGSIDPAGVTTLPRGGSQTYTITPAPGYKVASVLVDGVSKGAVTTYTISNIDAYHTIAASFTPVVYAITSTSGANGSVSPAGTVYVNSGSSRYCTITPDPGYHIVDVLVDGASVGPVTTYTFTNVTADHTLSATFAQNQIITITSTAGSNGTISPMGTLEVVSGTSPVYTISASAGYRVGDVVVDGVSKGALASYTFSSVSATNHTISASFVEDAYTITATAGANGTIAPAGATSVVKGSDSPLFVFTPAVGYRVSNVLVDGISNGALSSYLFTNVTANHTIAVTFTPVNYAIVPIQAANGTITPTNTVYVNYGASRYCTITPAAGYHVADVLVDGVSVGVVTSYTFTNVTSDHTITALFSENPAVTISASAGANGSISPAGDVSVLSGTSPTFTMMPAAGYRVADVTIDGVSKGALSSYTFAKVSGPHTIGVTFMPDVYTITATAGANGSIEPGGDITVNSGDSVTFTFTPAPGYKVLNVAVDGVYIGEMGSYTFANIDANHTITPSFALIP